ncbi:hypothetical protein BJ322DRAFT_311960 [Thelephora terrestris]|uniref:Uncharacterized protein n=1 Tax=Thelephora terrestris TaxID=56493 RepID=A0A9P6H668_9AGAM|nr:hypothetical protein BJ322DRAFT_311960 [Thelephora terrestris]
MMSTPGTPEQSFRSRVGTFTTPDKTNTDVNPGSATSPRIIPGGLSYGSITSTLDTPTSVKRVTLRADPALLTCFDPADRELYDLWAPQQR